MYILDIVLSRGVAEKLGWTLMHSLWQTVAIAVGLAIILRLLWKAPANVRYGVACLALILTVTCPVVTSGLLSFSRTHVIEQRQTMSPPDTEALPASTAESGSQKATPPEQVHPEQAFSGLWKLRLQMLIKPVIPSLICVWAMGVLGLSLWHLGGWIRLNRLKQTGRRPADPVIGKFTAHLTDRLGIRRLVQCLESANVQVPSVMGWFRPVILLPASAITSLSPEALEALLAHELAHIKRCDYLVNLLQTAIETLLFYHPGVWWISKQIRVERENCCDDLAVHVCQDKTQYILALATMEEIRTQQGRLAVAANGGHLLARIQRLAGIGPVEKRSSVWLSGLVTVSLVIILTIATGLAVADYATNPDTALEREVVKGFAANRDRFECGTLAWTHTNMRNGDYSDGQKRTLTGQYQMWWDGKKIATNYLRDVLVGHPSQLDKTYTYAIDKEQGSNAYDGSLLSFKPQFSFNENWMQYITRWTGIGSIDEEIKYAAKQKNLEIVWSRVEREGGLLIKCHLTNLSTGQIGMSYYDPSRGYARIIHENYARPGKLQVNTSVKMHEVVPGAWFPVEVTSLSHNIQTGEVLIENHYVLDFKRCTFNDRTALPEGIFKYSVKAEQQELDAILQPLDEKEAESTDSAIQALVAQSAASVQAFLDAALAGDVVKARQYLAPNMAQSDDIEQLKEMAHGQTIRIMAVASDGFAAFAVSSPMKADHGRTGPLTFQLIKSQGDTDRWLIQDIDVETPAKAGQDLEAFLKEHQNAKLVRLQ
jgi:beta-lactamase regulating signal transducer with metallopeptidase domain